MKNTLRKSWLILHRWLGLTVGAVLVLVGLTGSLLVFDHAIDEWLNPTLLLSQESGDRKPVAEVVAAAEAGYQGSANQAVSVTRPRVDHGVWTVWFSERSEEGRRFVAVHVDPFTAGVTGQRVWGEDLMSWVYRLHFRLLAGTPGAVIVGLVGIIAIVSIVSGVYLWWPLWKNSWRAAFAIRKGARFSFDLHKSAGMASAVFLLVIAFTGVYMEFHDWFRAAIGTFAEVTDPPGELTSAVIEKADRLSPDEAIAIAQERFPGATFDHLHPPQGADGFYEVAFRQPGEVQTSYGRSQVFLDQYSGELLALRRPQDGTSADAFFAWQFPLHNGEAFGLLGRWIVFVIGLTPAVLYVTGVVVWWRRAGSRRRQTQRNRKGDSPTPPAESAEGAEAEGERVPALA
ncbi:PepSY-associated TM helix [Stieleria maiorica]|uniref:PepSY-associated TM helix n=1 Tax=Stieleria maiorica TaxID=2795974 RepID=A0A5B9MQ83_9BACT|nr:PepSY-associated TM helix domain-containing protein [Stieleria maiorica]QEG01945.1 PepSY-associated TM helix [Stieleria maiorica]